MRNTSFAVNPGFNRTTTGVDQAPMRILVLDRSLEGMELTRQLKPDIVIADIEMPKKTGLELANWIKDQKLATQAWSESDPLTDRERQVLRLSAAGLTNSQIASKLNLNDGTVRNYISEAISKLSANNRIDAARIARDKGWL